MSLNKPNNEIDINTLAQESTSQEIKLSKESIKALADEIVSRVGLTNDTGGGTAEGSVFAKLNALLTQIASAGGINLLPVKEVSKEKYLKFNTTYYVYCTPISATSYPMVDIEGSGNINVYIFDKQILSADRATYIPAYTILKIKVTNAHSSYDPSAYIRGAFTLVLDM